jgi:putative nucleotidyltransferase with HDIG domain
MFVETNSESTFAKSQQLLKNFREILLTMTKSKDKRLADRLRRLMVDETDFYSHLSSVSCFSVIFAMALGHSNVDEIGLAGLLHDIGKTNFPREMVDLEYEKLSLEYQKTYLMHPQYSIDICNLKKLLLPERSRLAIIQHHERMDGTGYPKGLAGDRICPEAKILAIADRFAHLTTLNTRGEIMSPQAALSKLIEQNSSNPGQMELDRNLLLKIQEVITKN